MIEGYKIEKIVGVCEELSLLSNKIRAMNINGRVNF